MVWKDFYLPPNKIIWQGRTDAPQKAYFFQHIALLNLLEPLHRPDAQLAFALLGFCCDEGTRRNQGRPGAKEGPAAIRQMLATLALQRHDIQCYDAGDLVCVDGDLESAQAARGEAVNCLLTQGIVPIVLGGGHELAWGHYQGISQSYSSKKIAMVNIDAHLDMRPLLAGGKGSSGTAFLQIANAEQKANRQINYYCIGIQSESNIPQLLKTAKEHHTHIVWIDDLQQVPANTQTIMDTIISNNDYIYLSLCLDVFAAAYAPGVSAPQAFGATPWQIIPLVRQLASSKKVISYDIAELSPILDQDNRTAKLAANFIFEIIQHHSQGLPQST